MKLVRGGGQYATANTIIRGSRAEARFVRYLKKNNFIWREATLRENTKYHFDFVANNVRIEVKAIKSKYMGAAPDPNIIYVEIVTVNGNPGWIYGSADYIAFEQRNGFLMVDRKQLLKIVEEKKKIFPRAYKSGVHHTLYGRRGRDDIVMVLDISDVCKLPNNKFATC